MHLEGTRFARLVMNAAIALSSPSPLKAINYGEMTASSWSNNVRELGLSKDDVFVDLGSGRGTLVLQAALEVNWSG